MGDLVFGIELRHLFTREVCLIIGGDGMRKPEAAQLTLSKDKIPDSSPANLYDI